MFYALSILGISAVYFLSFWLVLYQWHAEFSDAWLLGVVGFALLVLSAFTQLPVATPDGVRGALFIFSWFVVWVVFFVACIVKGEENERSTRSRWLERCSLR